MIRKRGVEKKFLGARNYLNAAVVYLYPFRDNSGRKDSTKNRKAITRQSWIIV